MNCLVFVLIGIELPVIAESILADPQLSWPRVAGLVARAALGLDNGKASSTP